MKNTQHLFLLALAFSLFAFKNIKNNPAVAFLNALNKEQKSIAMLDFNDPLKEKWHFLPHSMFTREGISLKELEPHQKKLLFHLLETSLSESGYNKTRKIMNLENVLAEISGDPVYRDSEKYYASFYGNPETDDIWAWSFEGHHISLNFTISGEKTAVTPRFFGSNPATITTGTRKGDRTLAKEDDYGIDLVNALDDKQKQKAIFKTEPFKDIVTKNKTKVESLDSVGISFENLNKKQQELLLKLINIHIETMPKKLASIRMKNIKKENLNNIYFGWAGATQVDKPHYYRIQGKSFLVEFDNLQNNAKHIHVVWRDFNGDFGRDLIQEHYNKTQH